MAVPDKLKGRYDIKEVLGQGGMGLVFRAWDETVKRDVALKTLRDAPTRAALQLFYKECEVLAALSHPNIIEIFDIGEFEDEGKSKPFFVMPLLSGATLDKLIRTASHRLTVERVVDIVCQTCRGLQAAHERALIHRDIKPSNIFVMDDDSVKVIDFGVAHMAEAGMSIGMKGTLLYMAPEQLQMKPATPASDIYSLGVVCYETLTRRRPFEGTKESEIAEAILHSVPPPVSDLNPAVNQTLSRVIHKALAKQPFNRYSSAREFAETLQKGLHNEPIEFFDPVRIQPRIERATKAFEQGDLQFAGEILNELEAEGHIDPAITPLKRQIASSEKQKTVAQLLEAARRRFEHEEYPLALQKVQDILQLDPANGPALALKAGIENKLTSRKIEEWYRLAKQHQENQAWSHAREALNNVLQLKPAETRATQELAEVDRLEQEYVRLRKAKEELYHSALEAWNSGEVTSALSKMEKVIDLDHQAPETATPERAASYQTFYNRVRTQHESLKNSYAEAKKLLADRNFAQALAIAEEWLAKYPGHALFQALKFDIEEQQRQELSARIAEIDRQVEAEPDLDRRVSIIEQAVSQYPGEAHFERQLRPLRDKRDLVNSIVAKARYHEERAQFAEALAQWEILATIYAQYPGLAFEVERVTRKKDQQGRDEARARWTGQIDAAMNAGNYARALELCSAALTEFPNDAEIRQLEQLASESAGRADEAGKLLAEGQALHEKQAFDDAIPVLRRALELDSRNAAIRTALLDTLVDRARSVIDTDWRAAEPYIRQALEIDPNHLLAKSLRITAQDLKRDEAVKASLLTVRQLRAAGDLDSAVAEAEKCLAAYPLDPRLAQLRDILIKERNEARRAKSRPADLETMQKLTAQAEAATAPAEVQSLLGRARDLANVYPDDPEFHIAVASIEQRLAALAPAPAGAGAPNFDATATSVLPESAAVPPPLAESAVVGGAPVGPVPVAPPAEPALPGMEAPPLPQSGIFSVPAAPAAQASSAPPPVHPAGPEPGATRKPAPVSVPPAPFQPPPVATLQTPAPPPKPPAPPKKRPGVSPALKWGGIAAAAVVAVLGVALFLARRAKDVPAADTVRVEVRTWPPGAVVRINGKIRGTSNFRLEAPPGSYRLDASLEGYQPASTTVSLKKGVAGPIELSLQPLPQTVRVITDLADAQIFLDDQPPRAVQDGQVAYDAVSPGKHALKVASRAGESRLEFELVPGAVPQLPSAPVVNKVTGLVVSTFGNRARVYATIPNGRVQLDGNSAGVLGPEGLELTGVSAGAHELLVAGDRNQIKRVIETNSAPALTAFIQSDQNIGTLVILAGEDGADVFVDGEKYRRQTSRGGQLRIPRAPKEYRIRVAKSGFQDAPEQVVAIAKGEERKVAFQLVPLPSSAHLTIQGTPGAQVYLDQNAAGTVLADGTFQLSSVSPGEHVIELRKDNRRSRPVRRSFTAGQTISLTDSDLTLHGGSGTLRLNVSPAGAVVTATRPGRPSLTIAGTSAELDEGAYTITARATGYAERSEQVQVTGGQTAIVTLTLAREQRRGPAPSGMEGWEPAGAWTRDGDWYVRRGGGTILYRASQKPGTYAMNIMLASGGGFLRGKTLEWVAGYQDEKNYVHYRIERDDLRRFNVVNGRRVELPRKPHGLKFKDMMAGVQVEVAANTITVRLRKDDQWAAIDTFTAPDRNFLDGRFGIRIEGRDEVRISGFGFYPKD